MVAFGRCQQLTIIRVFADRRAALVLAILFIDIELGFCHQAHTHRQGIATGMIQTGHKVDAFNTAILAVVIMPTDDRVLVGVGLFGNTIINNHDPLVLLDLPHIRLGDGP